MSFEAFRAPPALSAALTAEAARRGVKRGALVRIAVEQLLVNP